jgi:hypothetical protein
MQPQRRATVDPFRGSQVGAFFVSIYDHKANSSRPSHFILLPTQTDLPSISRRNKKKKGNEDKIISKKRGRYQGSKS